MVKSKIIATDYRATIAEAVQEEMTSKGLNSSSLAKIIHEELGFVESTVVGYISLLRGGILFGSSSSYAETKPYAQDRLAKVLYAIGFVEDHSIIAILRQHYPNFQYPPQNAISYNDVREQLQHPSERINRQPKSKRKLSVKGELIKKYQK